MKSLNKLKKFKNRAKSAELRYHCKAILSHILFLSRLALLYNAQFVRCNDFTPINSLKNTLKQCQDLNKPISSFTRALACIKKLIQQKENKCFALIHTTNFCYMIWCLVKMMKIGSEEEFDNP